MFHRKVVPLANKVYWHADPVRSVPVDIDLSDFAADAGPQPDRGWLESSRDLQRGVRVRETPLDALPTELIDALLGRRP